MGRPQRVTTTVLFRGAMAVIGSLTVAGCGAGGSAILSVPQDAGVVPSVAAPSSLQTDPQDAGASTTPGTPTPTVTVKVTVGPKPTPAKVAATKTPSKTPSKTTAGPKSTPAGSVQPGAAKLVASSAAAAKGATFAHVVGTVVSNKLRYGVDLYLGLDGEGTLSYDKGSISVRRIGTALYLNADDAFFAAHGHPELAPTYNGKWMHIVPADPAYANILPLTYLSTWAALVGKAPAATLPAGASYNGAPATAVSGGAGTKANTLYLPAAGTALPFGANSADKVDTLAFSLWNNAPLPVQVPQALIDEPADAVVDVPAFPENTAVAFSALWRA